MIPCRCNPANRRATTPNTDAMASATCSFSLNRWPVGRLAGWRHLTVTDTRTAVDWAHQIKHLLDVCYPDADAVRLVMNNLNTHTPASLYKAFEPAEARRLAQRLEIHYTPKHGRWLNMAEIEFSHLGRQCLDRRIPDRDTLKREVHAWTQQRNQSKAQMNWRFTTQDARIKLKRLYPSLDT